MNPLATIYLASVLHAGRLVFQKAELWERVKDAYSDRRIHVNHEVAEYDQDAVLEKMGQEAEAHNARLEAEAHDAHNVI